MSISDVTDRSEDGSDHDSAEWRIMGPGVTRTRAESLQTLRCLGFRETARLSILRYWTIQEEADQQNHDPLGAVAAEIAELGEANELDHHAVGGLGYQNRLLRCDWSRLFEKIFTDEALEALVELGVYLEPNFMEAKQRAYEMVKARWMTAEKWRKIRKQEGGNLRDALPSAMRPSWLRSVPMWRKWSQQIYEFLKEKSRNRWKQQRVNAVPWPHYRHVL